MNVVYREGSITSQMQGQLGLCNNIEVNEVIYVYKLYEKSSTIYSCGMSLSKERF